MNKFILGNFKADFTFLHLVQKKKIGNKIKNKKNRYDKFNKNFYNKVQNGFLKLSNKKKIILKFFLMTQKKEIKKLFKIN